MNISPQEIEKKITERTKAIVPVHFAGRPCNMAAISALARRYNLSIIEDCTHAIESEYHGKKTGTFGKMGCFSFYVTKNIITGEGGMIITDDEEVAEKVKIAALHGMSKDAWKRFSDEGFKHYQVVSDSFKYNMTDMQASLGIHQLKRIDTYWERRRDIWLQYQKAFAEFPAQQPLGPEADTRHAYHLYTLLIDKETSGISRNQFLEAMTREGIGVGGHYMPVHWHPYYRRNSGGK